MPILLDNIELDETNVEFNYAADFIRLTNRLVYLTGKAGTGKTTFLKYIRQIRKENIVVLAPTGVAAMNAVGQTLHSFFQIAPSIYVPGDKRLRSRPDPGDTDKSVIYDHFQLSKEKLQIIRSMELLIIDEISMVRCDLLDVTDRLLRVFRKRLNEPFGGVQVILIGDTFQLPPVADAEEWDILSRFYQSPFFFSSNVIRENEPVYIELKKIYRQNDQTFINLLNHVRVNQISANDIDELNSRYDPGFSPADGSGYIVLATHNHMVESTNLAKLVELSGEPTIFEAEINGTFPENIRPTDSILQLKAGAQIMFVRNDREKRFFNGKIARIKSIRDQQIMAEFPEGSEIIVEKETWKNIRYTWNEEEKKIEEETIGTFTQFPVRLAWAITVHKSQGLTFERVVADLGAAFAPGQVYVALSRCTTFQGLVLKTKINASAIKTDPEVLKFAKNETPSPQIVQALNSGKADLLYAQAREAVKAKDFAVALDCFLEALNYRNDIETSTFRRYFLVIACRLSAFKTISSKNQQRVKRLRKKVSSLTEKNAALKERTSGLLSSLEQKEAKIQEQNNAVKLLLKETEKLENNNLKYRERQSELSDKIKQVQNALLDSQERKTKQEAEINELKHTVEELQKECLRLGSQKWYRKLFG